MKDIIIVCAGTFGIDVYNTIMSINRVAREAGREEPYRLLGFLNDIPGTLDGQGLDVGIIGTIRDWKPGGREVYALGLSVPKSKEKVAGMLKSRGAKFETLISPWTAVSDFAEFGEGCYVSVAAYQINSGVKLGNFVNINGSMIDDGAEIGDFSTTTGYTCVGRAKVGKRVFMGSRSVVEDGVTVGDDAFIGVGSVVTEDVEPGAKMFGNPARRADW